MDISTYRRNVVKTMPVKPAKAALRYVTRNTQRTNMLHAAIGVATEMGELIQGVENYLLIGKTTDLEKLQAKEELGDFAYYLTALAKAVKAKMPGSGKKLKLVGTRGKALLDLQNLVLGHGGILDIMKKSIAGGIATKGVPVAAKTRKGKDGKPIIIPAHETQVLDVELQKAEDVVLVVKMKEKVEAVIDLYYRLCYEMFNVPPAVVFQANIDKLVAKYPKLEFEQQKAPAQAATA